MPLIECFWGLNGDVIIFATQGDMGSSAHLSVGERFLFYLTPMLSTGDDGLSTSIDCGHTIPLKSATKSELTFRARLGGRDNDGHIFGEVSRYPPRPQPPVLFGGVRVTATDGKRSWSEDDPIILQRTAVLTAT